jgi:hypothetical protein
MLRASGISLVCCLLVSVGIAALVVYFVMRSRRPAGPRPTYVQPTMPMPPGVPPPVDVADQLRRLAELKDSGVLTEEEFQAQKAKLLGT